jgi:hypothetical protein
LLTRFGRRIPQRCGRHHVCVADSDEAHALRQHSSPSVWPAQAEAMTMLTTSIHTQIPRH